MMFGKKNSLMKQLGVYDSLKDANLSELENMVEESLEPFKSDKQSELELVSAYQRVLENESPKYVEETLNSVIYFSNKKTEEKPGRWKFHIAGKAGAFADAIIYIHKNLPESTHKAALSYVESVASVFFSRAYETRQVIEAYCTLAKELPEDKLQEKIELLTAACEITETNPNKELAEKFIKKLVKT